MRLVPFALVLASCAALAQAPSDGQWPMPARTTDGQRFSPLAQITPANVARLELAFSMPTGVVRGHGPPPSWSTARCSS